METLNKTEFKEKAKKSIDEIVNKIDELEKKGQSMKKKIDHSYHKQIEKLKAEKNRLQQKYDDLIAATDEKWKEAKNAFNSVSTYIKEGITDVVESIS